MTLLIMITSALVGAFLGSLGVRPWLAMLILLAWNVTLFKLLVWQ